MKKLITSLLITLIVLIGDSYSPAKENLTDSPGGSPDGAISNREYKKSYILRDDREIARLYLEKAHNNSTGLMFKDSLSEGRGMIFEFPSAKKYPFWMLNMRFPIDLLFFDNDGRLIDFYQEITPCINEDSCARYYPSSNARYAIEVNAGTVKRYGIKKGDSLYIESPLTEMQ